METCGNMSGAFKEKEKTWEETKAIRIERIALEMHPASTVSQTLGNRIRTATNVPEHASIARADQALKLAGKKFDRAVATNFLQMIST
jgi:hypothetical protein